MPELSRFDNEDRLVAVLLLLFQDYERKFTNGVAFSWNDFGAEMKQAIAAELVAVYIEAFGAMSSDIGLPFLDVDDVIRDAERWANGHAERIASDTIRNNAKAIERAKAKATTEDELILLLIWLWSVTRIERIVVTEVTAAISAGENLAAKRFAAMGGSLVSYWETEEDARVCPICEPLHDKPERVWKDQFPKGPPAHPRCRCRRRWVETVPIISLPQAS